MAVLDCANGYQEETREQVSEITEKRGQEIACEATSKDAESKEAGNCQEAGQAESRSE